MSLTDELFLDSSHWERRERKREENEAMQGWGELDVKERRRMIEPCASKWEMKTQRGTAWVGGGGLNRGDWQKQSASTVACLNLHRCRYTHSTPHQSRLMISNITQSFVIVLEPNQHCSLWLTLLSFNRLETHTLCRNIIQSQLGWGRVEGLSIWLKLTCWQQNILPATTQLRRMSLTVYLREVVMHCGATWKTEWWHLPPLKHN